MWENVVERGRAQMTIWRVRVACWIPKATDTQSEYVTLLQKLLHEGSLALFILKLAVCLELYWEIKLPLPGVNPVPMQLDSPKVSHGLTSEQSRASAVRNGQGRA